MGTFKAKYVGEAEGDIDAFGVTFVEGKSADVDDKWAAKVAGNPFFAAGEAKKADAPAKAPTTPAAKKADDTALKAEHHGGGKFNITKGEEVLAKGLSKADADAFNAMSDEDKTAYVADQSN